MRWSFAGLAKIVWRTNQAFAEMQLPDTIRHHARCERMLRLGEPFGELQPPAALERRFRIVTREDRWERFWRVFAGTVVIATNEDLLHDRVAVFNRASHFGFRGSGLPQLLKFLPMFRK